METSSDKRDGKAPDIDTYHNECEPHDDEKAHSSFPGQVQDFVQEHGLDEHVSLFERAMLLARDPAKFELMSQLQDSERQILREEIDHKWRLPKAMWMTAIVCSVGAAVQGWDQTGINGANLSFPGQLGIGSNSARDSLLVGLINAMPQLATFLPGCWFSEPLNNGFGRRGAIFVAAIFAFCSVIGSAVVQTWYQLLVCRILLGIGIGIKSSTTSVFAAESAPAAIRGTLVMGWQLWVSFGIFLGTAMNIAFANCGTITWRLQLGSAFIPAVPLLLLIYFCPESPSWYMKQGRVADAFGSFLKLRKHPILAARDLLLLHASLEEEKAIVRRSGNALVRFCELFTVPRNRRATLAASVVMMAQQICGSFLAAMPALRTIDTFGRRSLLLATFPHMAWSLLAAGLCFLIPGEGTARLAGIATLIYLFSIFYSLGEGPVCYVYAAKVFPLSHREIGMAWAVCVNAIGAFVLALTFPYMLASLKETGSFGLYCGLNAIAFVCIFLWVPETRQYTLEELDHIFSVPTHIYMRHQLTKTLPGWFKRWILWQRNVKIEPLKVPDRIVSRHESIKVSA
nr:polyol transporter 5 [Quercus suber]